MRARHFDVERPVLENIVHREDPVAHRFLRLHTRRVVLEDGRIAARQLVRVARFVAHDRLAARPAMRTLHVDLEGVLEDAMLLDNPIPVGVGGFGARRVVVDDVFAALELVRPARVGALGHFGPGAAICARDVDLERPVLVQVVHLDDPVPNGARRAHAGRLVVSLRFAAFELIRVALL